MGILEYVLIIMIGVVLGHLITTLLYKGNQKKDS